MTGDWGSVVVKALRYYSDGPGIDCHSYISKLKAGICYKTLVTALQTTRRHIPEDRYLNTHGRDAHKPQNQPSMKNDKKNILYFLYNKTN
jgi:hypothetical protein